MSVPLVQVILVIAVTVLVGILAVRPAARAKIPHGAFLVLIGTIVGSLCRGAGVDYVPWAAERFPTVVVDMLLPILVFESAVQMNFTQLKKDWLPITALSVFGMIISTWIVGECLVRFLGIATLPAFVFGALISATDPISILALFKDVKAPQRLIYLVEGESILNDGTAMVLFRVLLGSAMGSAMGTAAVTSGLNAGVNAGLAAQEAAALAGHSEASLIQFIYIMVGSVVFGGLMSLALRMLIRWNSPAPSSQIGLSIIGAYLTFIIGEHHLGLSGVLATMALGQGLALTRKEISPVLQIPGFNQVWELAALAANCVVFLAVGYIFDLWLLIEHWRMAFAAINIVFFARAVSVLLIVPPLNFLSAFVRHEPWRKTFLGGLFKMDYIRRAYQLILVWSGIRGGLALALVLSLPAEYPNKGLFLIMTLAVVVTTNLINSVATPWLMTFLKIHPD